MLVFDRFTSRRNAEEFANRIREKFGWKTHVCNSQEESDALDPFLFKLTPPIVLVERPQDKRDAVVAEVKRFAGMLAGT